MRNKLWWPQWVLVVVIWLRTDQMMVDKWYSRLTMTCGCVAYKVCEGFHLDTWWIDHKIYTDQGLAAYACCGLIIPSLRRCQNMTRALSAKVAYLTIDGRHRVINSLHSSIIYSDIACKTLALIISLRLHCEVHYSPMTRVRWVSCECRVTK